MELTELAKPPVAALPVAALRAQLRLGSGFASDGLQDGLLEDCLRAGMAAVERRIGRVLLARDFTLAVSRWAAPDRQPLPVAPVRAVNGVDLLDAADQTVAADGWRLMADDQAPALVAWGVALPTIPASAIRSRAGREGREAEAADEGSLAIPACAVGAGRRAVKEEPGRPAGRQFLPVGVTRPGRIPVGERRWCRVGAVRRG